MKTLSYSIVVFSSAIIFHGAAVSEWGDGRTFLFAVGLVSPSSGLPAGGQRCRPRHPPDLCREAGAKSASAPPSPAGIVGGMGIDV